MDNFMAGYLTSALLCFYGFHRAYKWAPELPFTWTQAAVACFITIAPGVNMIAAMILILNDLDNPYDRR